MIVVGLTGSVGMGKSTSAAMFREAGVPVFDADAAVHDLYRGEAVPLVEAAFPGVTRDGAIDRTVLAARVLNDTAALKRLEAIVHPLVFARRQIFLERVRAEGASLVVLDIPLLFETGTEAAVDKVVVVSAPEAVQKARVLTRPGMTEAKFSAIKAKQLDDVEKRRRADYVIDTSQSLDEARRQVGQILAALQEPGTG
jgi:dephospho-CoA kinase